jgi:hypothetical protein
MPKLWITGDSYSFIFPNDNDERVWINQLAAQLNCQVENGSISGASQDYCWKYLEDSKTNISPEDYIIVLLTKSDRYWLFEDKPEASNSKITNMAEMVGFKRAKIAKDFFKHIQRPELDILSVKNRLGWLDHTAYHNKWRKPLVIVGFGQDYGSDNSYQSLVFSKGNINENVSRQEQEDHTEREFFEGSDARYHHMIFSNHIIFAKKVYNSLVNNVELDLTQGFIKQILTKDKLENTNFASDEFGKENYQKYLKNRTIWRNRNSI